MDYKDAFANGLKAIIDEAGLKQNVIAKNAGMKAPSLSRILNGRQKVYTDDAYRICQAVGCSIEEAIKKGMEGQRAHFD